MYWRVLSSNSYENTMLQACLVIWHLLIQLTIKLSYTLFTRFTKYPLAYFEGMQIYIWAVLALFCKVPVMQIYVWDQNMEGECTRLQKTENLNIYYARQHLHFL